MWEPLRVGRYVLWREIAAGGMASVYLGRMSGPAGFGKNVAIKRMHAQFAKDAEFITMFLDEARITSGLTHPNIVMTLDVIEEPEDLFLVMEYVHGASLASINKAAQLRGYRFVPPAIAAAVAVGTLHGLHAAHEARSDDGEPLHLVHRDVSPQNILISIDGIAKIGDFGIAKAVGQVHSTSEGVTKGKQAYMAPEQAVAEPVTARSDVFAAGIVLWEMLAGRRLIAGASGAERLNSLLKLDAAPPSTVNPAVPRGLDEIVLRALRRDPNDRFPNARAMASAIEQAIAPASAGVVGEWVRDAIGDAIAKREEMLGELQRWARTQTLDPATSTRIVASASGGGTASSSSGRISSPGPASSSSSASSRASAHAPGSPRARAPFPLPTDEPRSETAAAISTDRNFVPPRPPPPRTVLVAIIAFVTTGVLASIIIVLWNTSGTKPTATAASTSSGTESAGTSGDARVLAPATGGTAAATAIPTATATATEAEPPPEPIIELSDAAAFPVTTAMSPSTPARPSAPRPNTPKDKCRIVPQRDAAGRTVFREVCGP